jgi:hypothetical protein
LTLAAQGYPAYSPFRGKREPVHVDPITVKNEGLELIVTPFLAGYVNVNAVTQCHALAKEQQARVFILFLYED